jgi:hypothetical protein
MNITPEELENYRLQFENEQKENLKYIELEAKYKQLIEQDKLDIELTWRDKTSNLDMDFLESKLNKDFFDDFKQNFSVVKLQLDRVLNFYCESEEEANRIYPKDKLWDDDIGRSNRKIVKILEYVENGNPLSPPIIDILNNSLLFYDGNHRVALARFLRLNEIPFAVRTSNIEILNKL